MAIKCISFAATTIILQHLYYSCFASFAESPSSVIMKVEEGIDRSREAVFRCRHQRIEAVAGISWRINGTSSRQYSDVVDGFVRDSNGTCVDTLTVPAIPEYNGTAVVCVATFLDGSPLEVTPSATLTIIITADFERSPSPLNITVEQNVAVFYCQHRHCDDITWRVNGTYGSSVHSSVIKNKLSGGGFNSSLSIETRLDYNETTVECAALFFERTSPFQFTNPVTLLIQDTPGHVNNLVRERNYSSNSFTMTWNPLPSLDLTDIDPDIVYTCDLFKTTCGQNVSISHRDVARNSATVENLDMMQTYKAVITARNNVPGARNGPSVKLEEKFISLNGSILSKLAKYSQINVTSPNPVPSYYTMNLESLDGFGHNLHGNITVERYNDTVNLSISTVLPPKALWKASLFPHGCQASIEVTELSTHDIQNVVVSSPHPGQISVTGNFAIGSTATGVLVIIYSLTNESDVQYIAKQPEQNDILSMNINVTGLIGTQYAISSFAMKNRVPFPRVVTSPRSITVHVGTNNSQEETSQRPTTIKYKLQPISSGVCITCTFLDSSTTDCVAVVHQRISQLNTSVLMNIESSHKFTRSGDTAYGCIEGVNLEQYQVGVINIQLPVISKSKFNVPDEEFSLVGAVVGAVLALALIPVAVVLIICGVLRMRWKIKPHFSEVGTTPPCLLPECTMDQINRYALTNKCTGKGVPDDLYQVEYRKIQPQPKTQSEPSIEPAALKKIDSNISVGIGIQESDSSSNSLVIDGFTSFSSDTLCPSGKSPLIRISDTAAKLDGTSIDLQKSDRIQDRHCDIPNIPSQREDCNQNQLSGTENRDDGTCSSQGGNSESGDDWSTNQDDLRGELGNSSDTLVTDLNGEYRCMVATIESDEDRDCPDEELSMPVTCYPVNPCSHPDHNSLPIESEDHDEGVLKLAYYYDPRDYKDYNTTINHHLRMNLGPVSSRYLSPQSLVELIEPGCNNQQSVSDSWQSIRFVQPYHYQPLQNKYSSVFNLPQTKTKLPYLYNDTCA